MDDSKPEFSVFYAWQSDRPNNRNRRFIQEAASEAIGRLNAERSCPFLMRIDQGTAGMPGLCDIPATILKKIDGADAFLCDLTYIAKSTPEDADGKARLCSNPNVLYELGYAFKTIGPERIICVMNQAYGPVANQIFDLAHRRFPIAYTLPQDGKSTKQVKAKLVDELESAFKPVLALGRRTDGAISDRVARVMEDFEAKVKGGNFFGLVRNHGALAIAVIPNQDAVISSSDLRSEPPSPPGLSCSGRISRGRFVVTFDARKPRGSDDPLRCAVTEMRRNGVILGAQTWVLDPAFHPEKDFVLPAPALETVVIETLSCYLERLRVLDARPPWTICVSVLAVRDYWLFGLLGQMDTDRFDGDDIRPDPIQIMSVAQPFTKAYVARLVKPIFDFIWQEFGFDACSNYRPDGSYSASLLS
jgi:hypothetical protein